MDTQLPLIYSSARLIILIQVGGIGQKIKIIAQHDHHFIKWWTCTYGLILLLSVIGGNGYDENLPENIRIIHLLAFLISKL